MFARNWVLWGVSGVVGAGIMGCGKSTPPAVPASPSTSVTHDGHSQDGWWCDEHGVPEDVCTQCDPKLVADFKAKGDWCKEHDRPDSQCFVCHPEKEAEFAAQYEAKYGKKPPQPHDDTKEEDHHKHDEKS